MRLRFFADHCIPNLVIRALKGEALPIFAFYNGVLQRPAYPGGGAQDKN